MNHLQKSNNKKEKLRGIFFQMGLIIACGLTFLAFEWKTSYTIPEVGDLQITPIDDEPYPILVQIEKKIARPKVKIIPKPNMEVLEIVSNDEVEADPEEGEEESVDFNLDEWITKEEIDEALEKDPIIPGIMPEFVGGDNAMFEYLAKNTRYPRKAIDERTQGTVHVEFVVGKNGKMRDFKIAKGVSKLLDKEALRVVKNMPEWIPGKQHGKNVSVRYTLPICFHINE